jgi:hypothetical protein
MPIFYLPRADDVPIVRVLDAAQDWWRFLGILGAPKSSPAEKIESAPSEE